jgi:hypothetical protein
MSDPFEAARKVKNSLREAREYGIQSHMRTQQTRDAARRRTADNETARKSSEPEQEGRQSSSVSAMKEIIATEEVRAVLREWANDMYNWRRAQRAHEASMSSRTDDCIVLITVDDALHEELREVVRVSERPI